MCAAPVQEILDVLRDQPGLVVHVLQRLLGWELEQPVQAVLVDAGDTRLDARGRAWRAHLAVELRRLAGASSFLAVVAPAARDEYERAYLWPCYAALLGVRRGGPAGLLAVVPGDADVAWARQTVSCGFGALTFTPLAITGAALLGLRDALAAERAPREDG